MHALDWSGTLANSARDARAVRWSRLFAVITTITVGHLLFVGGLDAPWLLYLLALGYAGYLTAALLVLTRRVRGRRAIGLACAVVVLWLAREGKLGGFVVGYNVYSLSQNVSSSSHVNRMGSTSSWARRPLACDISCGDSVVCQAAIRDLCPTEAVADAVRASVRVEVEDPFCYTPFYKSSRTSVSITARLHAGQSSARVSWTSDVELSAVGPMSCRAYRQLLARTLRATLVRVLESARERR